MYILGISAFYHDSAAAIIRDGVVLAAAQEERFSRVKHDAAFPVQAIRFCLKRAGVSIDELAAVVFYDKPFLKFERLLETYYAFAPRGWRSFVKAMPVWLKEKLFLKRTIRQGLKKVGNFDRQQLQLLFPEHHLSHAASAFYPSPFERAAILTIDGVGEWATASIGLGEGRHIRILKELHFPHSLGLLYSAFTYFLGFRVNSGEYKLMGLAPYGDPGSEEVSRFKNIIRSRLVQIAGDGSIRLNQDYFKYAWGLRMVDDKKWKDLFGMPRRPAASPLESVHCNLGLAIQQITEEVVIRMAREAKRLTGADQLCMAGGVALNCVANGKIQQEGIFRDIFIQPAAGDAGGALGAALAAHHLYFEQSRKVTLPFDQMQGAMLGPDFSADDIREMARKYDAPYKVYSNENELCRETARLIDDGQVVGWMQGRMEFGPRALGSRSILADPRNPEMQRQLNLKIKNRESFRPFAPSVLEEEAEKYFDLKSPSPYMLQVHPVNEKWRYPLPVDFRDYAISEKLYFRQSQLPAVTHVDMSARIQTVSRQTNPRYHALLSAFKERTGLGMLVNTSFNVRGEPIVCSPEDAYRCFMQTEIDYLVVENFIFDKKEQGAVSALPRPKSKTI